MLIKKWPAELNRFFRSVVIVRFSKLKTWFNDKLKPKNLNKVFIELIQLCGNPAIYFKGFVDI